MVSGKRYVLYRVSPESLRPTPEVASIEGKYQRLSPVSGYWGARLLNLGGLSVAKILVLSLWERLARAPADRQLQIHVYMVDSTIAHYCVSLATRYHMPWLGDEAGIEVGTVFTAPPFRGNGIYPVVLGHIVRSQPGGSFIYMIADEENLASRRGIEKAGFVESTRLLRSKRLGLLPTYLATER